MSRKSKEKSNMGQMDDPRGQHFVECDDCETRPAQFHCITCQGHLCEACKITHETRRLTQGHEVIPLSKYIFDPHACHNGKGKEPCACDIRRTLKEERDRIDNEWIPALEKLRDDENDRKESLSDKVSCIIADFEDHCEKLIDKLTEIKERTVNKLERKQENITDAIDHTIDKIESKINRLENRSTDIGEYLDWDPDGEELNEKLCKKINEARLFPEVSVVHVEEFCPGSLEKKNLQAIIGKFPVIKIE